MVKIYYKYLISFGPKSAISFQALASIENCQSYLIFEEVTNDRLLSHSLLFLTNRSSGATSNSCSPLNATSGSGRFTPVNPRAKVCDQI